ncbi:hypothetical protein [Sphingopyxis flava]|uniref:Uncharacterized protein n=1 Tax=Sphingopyxis flava TaxID=1507287 RepID=A0A1T5EIR7_9SPHN|nr:hypothetical protein [Sphingopyxis flava]SKB83610.1 hypothetical protein SAMN06295937_102220 [Sphingopyxis flava]
MLQIAAALLFAIAAGLGIAVILGMLKMNGEAILSALAGEGAFPINAGPQTGPVTRAAALRRAKARRDAPRPVGVAMPVRSPLSRAA